MPLFALAFVLLVPVLAIVLMPFTLVQRYRVGSSRRRARGWVAALNVLGLGLSTIGFLLAAAMTDYWVPGAFVHALAGTAAGGLLGLFGLVVSRWEHEPEGLHYTQNRWLVLAITLVVAGRIGYGFWRAWHSGLHGIAASGATASLAAGGIVLGYYLSYWLGVRRRLRAHVRDPRRGADRGGLTSAEFFKRRARAGRNGEGTPG
jgi:hypothetical protein